MSHQLHQLTVPFDTTSWCDDCALSVPLTVAPAGDHGFDSGIFPHCLYAADILGVLAIRELAQILLRLLDPSQQADPTPFHPTADPSRSSTPSAGLAQAGAPAFTRQHRALPNRRH